ncbi:MAG: S8 family serine peptidase [Acidobacteriota bacterium]
MADTYVLRPSATSPDTAAATIGVEDVGEKHCTDDRCIVIPATEEQQATLKSLALTRSASVQAVPNAHKVYFAKATWDADTGTFDRDFPAMTADANTGEGLFVVVFKSYPEAEWLAALEKAGLTVMEPLPTMAYLVYGDRVVLERTAAKSAFVYRTLEIPPGIKRDNLDTRLATDGDEPAATLVAIANVSGSVVRNLLTKRRGSDPPIAYEMNHIVALEAALSRDEAIYISEFPEVEYVSRMTYPGGPSDERSNRVLGGTFQVPGTSWPASGAIGTNAAGYWSSYLAGLSGIGVDPSRQSIALFDTGIDAGLAGPCPPHLTTGSGCSLIFTSDVTTDFNNPSTRALDHYGHGGLTTAIAAGFVGTSPPTTDGESYAFTQGVAQGAKVSMLKFFGGPSETCDADFRTAGGGAENQFALDVWEPRVRYGIAVVSGANPLPASDFPTQPPGPGASIFNHSWNYVNYTYEAVAVLFDQSARMPSVVGFDFGTRSPGGSNRYVGTGEPILHVIASGNCGLNCTDFRLYAPGYAKNGITVGGTEAYNQQGYASGAPQSCATYNNAPSADNTNTIATFSRVSPDTHLKPDLVAPSTRIYGRRSSTYIENIPRNCYVCNADLTGNAQYSWDDGTSFAAPAVAGAATLVREWLSALQVASPYVHPSPAMVRATLLSSARFLSGRPVPDASQGYGGVSLDSLFRPASNYYLFDQKVILPNQGSTVWEKTLTVVPGQDVYVGLAWTDRASDPVGTGALVNDLDLRVQAQVGGSVTNTWYGNNFAAYYSAVINAPAVQVDDRVNTSEVVRIRASDLGSATAITVRVTAYSLTGDGILPLPFGLHSRQDFAVAVVNAHQ